MGIIGENSQKEDLIQETSKGVEATILIIGQLTILFKYIKGRTDLKKAWWSTATPEERKVANKTNGRRKKKTTTKKKPSTEITDQSLT